MKKIYALLALSFTPTLHLMTFLFSVPLVHAQFEGRVVYEMTYTAQDEKIQSLAQFFPKKSELIISGNNARFQQNINGGAEQIFISNPEKDQNTLVMNFLGEAFKVTMSSKNMATLEPNTQLEVHHSTDQKTINGLKCQRAFALHEGDTLNFYYNAEIYAGNILPQFHGLQGLVMEYETIHDGLHISFKATEIKKEQIASDWFEVSDQIKEVAFDEFAKAFAFKKES
jgi:GLPGLI family protein